jgi:DNA-binding transcriptional ArsR family regulator
MAERIGGCSMCSCGRRGRVASSAADRAKEPLWTAGTRPAPGSTIRLLGRPRAELLEALRSPATTTDLARALDVTPSAVSQHLAILRENGLVTGERIGRTVLYITTERGLDLLDSSS